MLIEPEVSVLPVGSVRPASIAQHQLSEPGHDRPAAAARARPRPRPASDFTALARQVQEAGWMRRRYGYYWSRLVGAVVLLAAMEAIALSCAQGVLGTSVVEKDVM